MNGKERLNLAQGLVELSGLVTFLLKRNETLRHNRNFLTTLREGFNKNPAYGRQRISRPMRIVGPIQFWRGCMIYLKKKNQKKSF